jgi:hypothetical protein
MNHDIKTLPVWAQDVVISQNNLIILLSDEVKMLREEKRKQYESERFGTQ